ncbi:hypothetical protein [Candidatus Vallotiella sp. (ex Adelges kitamiensis)]|uniref:hypothetical protein n=1 Tax=Candidatus Vallotiella sp. (ex Adelges kitamiensis) TaxID=2864217 RepID=UPI001CE37779|nr:hypothetical protein [Candidatus Vallotia sp. (ex Adelges kitamiensis)]
MLIRQMFISKRQLITIAAFIEAPAVLPCRVTSLQATGGCEDKILHYMNYARSV